MNKRDQFHKLKDWDNFKKMRNKVLHLIRKNKEYYNKAIKKGAHSKDLWRNLRKVQNIDNSDNELAVLPSQMVFNGENIEGNYMYHILNSFNDHFINIANVVKKKKKSECKESTFSYLYSHLDEV